MGLWMRQAVFTCRISRIAFSSPGDGLCKNSSHPRTWFSRCTVEGNRYIHRYDEADRSRNRNPALLYVCENFSVWHSGSAGLLKERLAVWSIKLIAYLVYSASLYECCTAKASTLFQGCSGGFSRCQTMSLSFCDQWMTRKQRLWK